MLTSSITSTRILGLASCCTRMPEALCKVRALTSTVDMFFACAFEEATTIKAGCSGLDGGHMKLTALETGFCTTWVFPEPPCPSKSK